jgi:hypothetical protein
VAAASLRPIRASRIARVPLAKMPRTLHHIMWSLTKRFEIRRYLRTGHEQ